MFMIDGYVADLDPASVVYLKNMPGCVEGPHQHLPEL